MTPQQLRIAFFNAQDKGSGAEDLIHKTVAGLIDRGVAARLYAGKCETGASYVYPFPFFPREREIELRFRWRTGRNDYLFPSTTGLGWRPWIKDAHIWHFHNLHGHFISIPLLGRSSRKHRIVLSPVDQFLSTGYCPYTLGCERYRESCGECPQLDLPYPGISRDATSQLLNVKKRAIRKSQFSLLVHTDYLAQHYASTFVGERPIERIRYGVDVRTFQPMDRNECAAKLSLPISGRFTLGLFHSYVTDKRKGIFSLLELLSCLAERVPDQLEVLVVGHQSETAKAYATDRLRITTLPFLKSEEHLAMSLNLCDVLLYPTRAENLSLTCLQALACGVPVISTMVGGQVEAIRNGVSGFTCEPDDNEQIVARAAELISNRDLLRELSAGARRTAVAEFDINRYIDQLVSYYQRLLGTTIKNERPQ